MKEDCLKKAFAEIFKNGAVTREDFKKQINNALKDCDENG